MQKRRPVMLVILDGWGWREEVADNAVRQARTPNFDRLWAANPRAFLTTCGLDVGLPPGQMGNSEVGHINIGAGRVAMQDLPRINAAVASGELATEPAMIDLIARLRLSGGTCHLVGLVSPGGVHSHQDHCVALAKVLTDALIPAVVHAITDGRDTAPQLAQEDLKTFAAALPPSVPIVTVVGRYYAMDRDKRWERVSKAYHAIVEGEGPHFATVQAAITDSYASKIHDEFIIPAVIGDYQGIKDGDALLSFNFRADRVREILGAMLDPAFTGFPRRRLIRYAAAVGMTQYSEDLDHMLQTIFLPQTFPNILGEVTAREGRTQLRMAETEKYPHVTYFLNGGREEPYAGEDRIMVPSPKVATYDLQPEMSALELAAKAVAAIDSGKYDLIVLNFANADMVGHTGMLHAVIKAVETVDTGLGQIADAIARSGGALLVTADHGNAEMLRDPVTGGPHTSHTTFPVPVMVMGSDATSMVDGRLADVAPTLLDLMGLPKPTEMTGSSMLRR
ncbi:MAG: 2,3-bisphosphoglycerate-independent phosphoglycerate mutase [Pseudolabrys sp.]|nr:2,3-bisphosphoglycerate-independent phosphoglycerate mutase [Pseudolabrys sp.]